jgi:tetratricopeptide (TPR) repeat protein
MLALRARISVMATNSRRAGKIDRSRLTTALGSAVTVTILGFVLLLPPGAAAQSTRKSYQEAVEALEQKRLDEAVGMFEALISSDPEARKRMGVLSGEPYLPYYYLGQALFERGDCEGALEAWQQSLDQGVVQELPENLELHRGKAVCTNRLEVASAALEAEESLASAENRLQEVREGLGNPELAEFLEGLDVEGRLEDQSRILEEGGEALATGTQNRSIQDVRRATQLGQDVTRSLDALNREAETRLTERRTEIGERIRRLVDSANATLSATAYLRPYPPDLGRQREMLESVVGTASARIEDLALGDLVRLAGQLQSLRGRLEDAAAPPPKALRDAAEAYVNGDLASVLDLLAGTDFRGRSAAHAHLLRAAALYSLAQSVAESEELREQARAEVRDCARADERLTPTERVFSPRFVEFFSETLRVEEPSDGEDGSS